MSCATAGPRSQGLGLGLAFGVLLAQPACGTTTTRTEIDAVQIEDVTVGDTGLDAIVDAAVADAADGDASADVDGARSGVPGAYTLYFSAKV